MRPFSFEETELKGAYFVKCFNSSDPRGSFTKTFERSVFENAGIHFDMFESFVSTSSKNVIRGLHFQTRNPQSKYVSVVSGKALDVIVDLRKDSETYKKWAAFELSAENGCGLYIPAGFAHGFLSLEDDTAMFYQCEGKYDKETDTGITVFDRDIAIDWPVSREEVTLSDRDKTFKDLKYFEENNLLNEFRVKNG